MSTIFKSNAERFAKKAEDAPAVFGRVNLTDIRENVNEILKLVGRNGIFNEYTLHDTNHIDAILQLVDKLIPQETIDLMKVADWLLIVLACYFHDLGMLVTSEEYDNRLKNREFNAFVKDLYAGEKGKDYKSALDSLSQEDADRFLYQEFIRGFHAHRISNWIMGEDEKRFGDGSKAVAAINELLSGLNPVFRDDLAKVCLSHHESDLYDFDKYKIRRVYGDTEGGTANLHFACLILRAADVLQIQKSRVPSVLYKLIDPSNPKSQEEWAKQAGVRSVLPKPADKGVRPDTFEVHASFEKESAYFGLMAYLQQYASKEIERCHEWSLLAKMRGSLFEFPWTSIDTSQVEPRGFEGRPFGFTLDQEKILTLLTGHTLYNDSRVAVREILQNSLDAVRFRKFLNPGEPIGHIEIEWDPKSRKFTVRDSGTGMTQETIEKFLLNVGSSFYNSETVVQKYGDFSPISRFGIGILSAFMIADEVRILTVHPEDAFARQLTLPSVVKSYLVKKLPKSDPKLEAIGEHGTEVSLTVRRSAGLDQVEQLVRYWMVIPGCKVTYREGGKITEIGFKSASEVLSHYYSQSADSKQKRNNTIEFREKVETGIDLAFVVSKWYFYDLWEFETVQGRLDPDGDEVEPLDRAPGMCIEGIRVRSSPAGYTARDGAPWSVVNLTGREAPKTNVARSDLEQTPALERSLARIFSLLGTHAEEEFERMRKKGQGLANAAREADFIIGGLLRRPPMNRRSLEQAISDLRIIAMEDSQSCRPISRRELESMPHVWAVDNELLDNVERICGNLGLNETADGVIARLGSTLPIAIPKPRVLGYSARPFSNLEVDKIVVHDNPLAPRLDLRWSGGGKFEWTSVPGRLIQRSRISGEVRIAFGENSNSICPGYDVVKWRSILFVIPNDAIRSLYDAFGGMTSRFVKWIMVIIQSTGIPIEEQPLLREQLLRAGVQDPETIMAGLTLPLSRRYGERAGRHGSNADDYLEA